MNPDHDRPDDAQHLTVLAVWPTAVPDRLAAALEAAALAIYTPIRCVQCSELAAAVVAVDQERPDVVIGSADLVPDTWCGARLTLAVDDVGDPATSDVVAADWVNPQVDVGLRLVLRGAQRERGLRAALDTQRRRDEMLVDAQRAARVGSWIWHVAADVVELHETAARLRGFDAGCSRRPARGEHLSFVHPHDRSRVARSLDAAITESGDVALECRLTCADGIERCVRWVGRVERGADGRAERVVVTEQDVTERQASAAQLRESRNFLELALRAARVAAWRYHARSRELHASAGAARLLGLDPVRERVSWRAWLRCVHAGDRPRVVGALRELRGASRSFRVEHRLAVEPERWVEVAGSWTPLGDAGDVGPTGTIQDVTERRLTALRTQRLDDQLRHVQKLEAVGRLASGVAHDFNNVLTTILGHAQLCELAARSIPRAADAVAEHHRAIEGACRRAISLTRQLLQIGRREPRRVGRTDVAAAIGELEPVLRRLVREDITIQVTPGARSTIVDVERGRFDQVLMNLVVNACDAMPDGGRLQITTADLSFDAAEAAPAPGLAAGRYLRLAVADTGTGIKREDLERVFEPFFTTKARDKGTGLGLSIIQGIATQAGGAVGVQSEPGHGTRFDVYFPVAMAEAGEPAPDGPDDAPSGGDELVLVCEDQPEVRRSMTQILSRAGYAILEAGNAVAALEAATSAERPPDILVTDVVLPGMMNGPQLARTLAATHPDLAMLFVTGYSAGEFLDEDAETLAGRLLSKPFRGVELLRHVRAALDGRRVRA